jgi:hypothetical protein
VPVEAPRPRDLDDPFLRILRDEIFAVMGLDHFGQRVEDDAQMSPQAPVNLHR